MEFPEPVASPFQIPSLSGGGFLGLYTSTVLAELERETGRPIADAFDLIARRSVGGIIALALRLWAMQRHRAPTPQFFRMDEM